MDNILKIQKLKKIVGCAVFVLFIIWLAISVTHLFRPGDTRRLKMVGIKKEKNIDMVYIGGSAAFVYWQPLRAWNDFGFTSYNVAVDGIAAESIKYHIKHVLKYQSPELIVIDARPFQYYNNSFEESRLRWSSDNMDVGSDRIKLINQYWSDRTVGKQTDDKTSYYMDIIKYHTDFSALSSPIRWDLIDDNVEYSNTTEYDNKGFEWIPHYQFFEEPRGFYTDVRSEVNDERWKILYDLLDFCKEEKLNVLFVVCPYQITQEDYKIYNRLGDIITSYDFDFLNTNNYYNEMNINFSTDYYNLGHVNCFGAEKYTSFLGQYIVEHYNMPNHSGDESYRTWEEDYNGFADEEKSVKETTRNLIRSAEEGKYVANTLAQTKDVREWCDLASDSRFTLFAVGDCESLNVSSVLDKKSLADLGMDFSQNNNIMVISDSNVYFTEEESDEEMHRGSFEVDWQWGTTTYYTIDNRKNKMSIVINDKEYSRKAAGMNIVVYENDYNYVVDSVTIKKSADGSLELVR